MGVISESANDGQEAIDKFIANCNKTCCNVKYKFVFMDLNMPIVDGFQATQRILAYQ